MGMPMGGPVDPYTGMPVGMPMGQPMGMPMGQPMGMPMGSGQPMAQGQVYTNGPPGTAPQDQSPVPEAQPHGQEENAMQAQPSVFTNERGNLKFVAMVSKCPCLALVLAYVVAIVCTVILSMVLAGAVRESGDGFAIAAIVSDVAQYELSDVRSIKQDAFELAMKETGVAREELTAEQTVEEKTMTQSAGIFYLLYETEKDGGFTIFNSDVAKDLKKTEELATKEPDFDKWCQRTDNAENTCILTDLSPLRFLYASQFNEVTAKGIITDLKDADLMKTHKQMGPCYDFFVDEGLCDPFDEVTDEMKVKSQALSTKILSVTKLFDAKGEEPVAEAKMPVLAEFVAYMKELPSQAMFVDFHLDNEFNTTNTKCKFTRSIVSFGGPLPGYRNTRVDEDEQEKKTKKYIIDNLEASFLKASKGGYSDFVTVYYFMTALILDIFLKILQNDGMLAFISIALVFTYIWITTGSVFLASVGMSEIVLSLPVAWFFVRCILQIKYFAGINLMCIFIVCAIGADDIFVFMDAYVQSQYKGPNVVRDMETRFSWVYRKSGLAMLITSCTTCSAFLCCFATPLPDTQAFGLFAAAVIAADYIFVMTMFCTAVMVYHNRLEKAPMCGCNIPTPMGKCFCGCCIENCDCSVSDPSPTQKALTASSSGTSEMERDKIEMFFRTKFAPLINDVKVRAVIAVVMVAWLIPAIIFVFKLTPTTTPEQFLNKDHPFQKAINVLNNNFGSNSRDPGIDIFYVWGLKDVDRSGVNVLLNTSNLGKVVYEPTFTFNAACQDKIMQVCEDFKVKNTTVKYLDMIQRNKQAQGSIKCFMYPLKAFQTANPTADRNKAALWMDGFLQEKVESVDDEDTTKMIPVDQFYNTAGGARIGWDGTTVKFVGISIEAKQVTQWDQPAEDYMLTQYEMYDDLRANIDFIAKEACGSEVIMTDRFDGMADGASKFVFMNNQRVYRTSAIRGALIGVAIAFVVLFACTWSPLLAIFATLSILCTMLSVIGLTTMAGWNLGSTEAILISILAGFSVDYVVHLAHAFSHNYGTQSERVTATFSEMGSPVLSGMITSVLASLPLFLCQLQFFAKFGTFLCLTILFSWLFANFGFMGVLATIGGDKERPGSKEEGEK